MRKKTQKTLAIWGVAAALAALPFVMLAENARAISATWYGPGFYGNPTTSGEIYTGQDLTAAHPSLPFGTILRITGPSGKEVPVRINDRCSCSLDLSEGAAEATGVKEEGRSEVSISTASEANSASSADSSGSSKPSDSVDKLPDTGGFSK